MVISIPWQPKQRVDFTLLLFYVDCGIYCMILKIKFTLIYYVFESCSNLPRKSLIYVLLLSVNVLRRFFLNENDIEPLFYDNNKLYLVSQSCKHFDAFWVGWPL